MGRYVWNTRKAARNLREHGISFELAEKLLLTNMAIPVEEQYEGGEWRTLAVAPLTAVVLVTIVVAMGEEDESSREQWTEDSEHAEEQNKKPRIISARQASERECRLYLESNASS